MGNVESEFNPEVIENSHEVKKNIQVSNVSPEDNTAIVEDSTKSAYESLYSLIDTKAENRNFGFFYRVDDGELLISLKNEKGKLIDLNEYVPKGYHMVPEERFGCDVLSKKISFNPRQVDRRGFLLSLAHELGHAKRNNL